MYVANALEIKEKRELLSDEVEVEDKVKFRIELIQIGLNLFCG